MAKKFNDDLSVTREKISSSSQTSKIYFGADSERINVDGVWHVDYLICVILHEDGCHGASVIYGAVERERDFDKTISRPFQRLFTEVMKISAVFLELNNDLGGRDVSIHLDINSDKKHGSSCAVAEAVGYIKGVCGIDPVIKPNSWAASIAADRLKNM